jgi:sugar lactone lactonase YvrE
MSRPTPPAQPGAPMTSFMKPTQDFLTSHVVDYRYVLRDTIQPFAPGDVFLGCTYLNDPTDDHAGLGRILQFDADLKPKGVLWTRGHRHLLIGLRFDRASVLWGFDIHTQAVIRVDAFGRQLPEHRFAHRAFGAVAFARDGSIYFGETLKGETPYWGSHMQFVPGTNKIGDGHIFKFDASWRHVDTYATETAPELSGFKGVTHLALHPSEQYLAYVTETGKRLMRYDVLEKRQMPDLARIEGGDLYDRNWFIALDYLANGDLLVTRGDRVERYDEAGRVIANYSLSEFGYGFAQVTVCADQRHALAANVFTGIACKWSLESGKIVAHVQTDHASPRRSLAGIAEYPG